MSINPIGNPSPIRDIRYIGSALSPDYGEVPVHYYNVNQAEPPIQFVRNNGKPVQLQSGDAFHLTEDGSGLIGSDMKVYKKTRLKPDTLPVAIDSAQGERHLVLTVTNPLNHSGLVDTIAHLPTDTPEATNAFKKLAVYAVDSAFKLGEFKP
jgi:hypothetical protein